MERRLNVLPYLYPVRRPAIDGLDAKRIFFPLKEESRSSLL